MTFVSYAQNFEDVLLWRALRGVENGFYIDVGAAHPDIDSVTRAFYDRGWTGINVEPTAEFSLRLTAARPRDINLQLVLGEHAGRAELFVVDGTGLSTMEPGAVDPIRKAGLDVRSTEVGVDTLANLCRNHAPATVHFLKIDVEGAEQKVLAGADFTSFRPWIVLVEATAPMSNVTTHEAWEHFLLDADYRFVWFDGLNRFYVSAEQHDALAHAFQTPVNVFDDFLRAADSEWARRIQEAENQSSGRVMSMLERAIAAEGRAAYEALAAAHARTRADEVSREADGLRAALHAETARRVAAEAQAAQVARRVEAAEEHVVAETQRAIYEQQRSAINEQRQREAMAAFDAMRQSTSWRITAPLRRLRSRHGADGPVIAQAAAPPALPQRHGAAHDAGSSAAVVRRPVPARTVVHQFHSGAATGDAITNSMLLTRRRLRDLGYDSEIFVTFRDPALAHELRLTEELPRHEHYILIVRHSMGFDAFDAVASLPAPKILLYHNITPPELLRGDAFMQRYAALGREQLKQWRSLIGSSLADSEYNAVELRALGFHPVQVCNTLLDVDALLETAAATPKQKDRGRFTILFVGRVVPSKGQAELLEVFAAFRSRYRKPCRLVLVGRHGNEEDAYFTALKARAAEAGIAYDVVVAGSVSDDELHAYYAGADVYLSLSRHEGFGVPLIEAMAHDLPVLALAVAAVPYTMGGTGGLLSGGAINGVVDRLLDLAETEGHRVALVARQRVAIERVRWEHHEGALLQALAAAGAAPPLPAETRHALSESMQFTVTGHVNGSYSLAAINRTLALALDLARPGCVRLAPVETVPITDLSSVPGSRRAEIEALAARPKPVTAPHVVISQHYPVLVPSEPGDLTLAYFFWEESVIPIETITRLNANFHAVLAPTAFVKKTLIDSGLSIPVRLVSFAPQLEAYEALASAVAPARAQIFTFLHVSSGFPRKGIDALLAAYARAFRITDRVCLVIKVFPNPLNIVAQQVAEWQAAHRNAAPITVIDCDMSEADVLDLYRNADAVVLPTRGEGFNLPAAEAMAAGLPLIVTGYSGHLDFVSDSVRLIDYSFASSGSHLAVFGSLWVDPDVDDLVRAMADAVAGRVPKPGPPRLPDARSFGKSIATTAADLLLLAPRRPLRIGWVSSWGVRCGIAEYSRHLLEAIVDVGEVGEITVLCDTRTVPDAAEVLGAAVRPCWDLGLVEGATSLAVAVAQVDPDVLVIQHQPGLMVWESLVALLRSAAVTGRPAVLVLHATQRILDIPDEERDATIVALASVARIMVHTIHDVNRLKALGLVANVVMIPQGALTSSEAAVMSPAPSKDRPAIIGCYGFFFREKGILQLIEAMARLRERHGKIRLRLVNAQYDTPASAEEIARCRKAAKAAGLEEAVEWHTEFLSDQESLRLLGECDIIALPYQESKEGSSAALRMAMSTGVPVAVTPLPLFDEVGAAVYRFRGTGCADIADGIAFLLDHPEQRQAVQAEMRLWLADRRWAVIARRFQGMLQGLSVNWRHEDKPSRRASSPIARRPTHWELKPILNTSAEPQVSVIVVKHGHGDELVQCLASLSRDPPRAAMEVIVVEPGLSAPETSYSGARPAGRSPNGVVDEASVLAARIFGAKAAKGSYLFFLDDMIEVSPGSIDAFVDLLDARPEIGMAGPKVLLPDRRMAEAGQVLWQDGSRWQPGCHDDPTRPAYAYGRLVDAVGPDGLFIRRSLFRDLAGFDAAFNSAAYSAADLAFQVRGCNRQVAYEPHAVIRHRAAQADTPDDMQDRQRFREKWSRQLLAHQFPKDLRTMRVRDCARGKQIILIIDRYIPEPDHDAGSRSVMDILSCLLDAGWIVKFWPHDRRYSEIYTPVLEARGVEVLDRRYPDDLEVWLDHNGDSLDHCLVCRPSVALDVMMTVIARTPARLSFYGIDLHHARMRLEAEVSGNLVVAQRAERMQVTEQRLWRQFDTVIYPSEEEAAAIRALAPETNAVGIVPYSFSQFEDRHGPTPGATLLFVGGFEHSPNVDAAVFLVEQILPIVAKDISGVRVILAGSHPDARVLALAGPSVTVTGWVTDERLGELYRESRVAVVPLRYGAGVKGKLVEALREGLPLVTTLIGTQGLDGLESLLRTVESAEDIARDVVRLIRDDQAWMAQSKAQVRYAREHFSKSVMQASLLRALTGARAVHSSSEAGSELASMAR